MSVSQAMTGFESGVHSVTHTAFRELFGALCSGVWLNWSIICWNFVSVSFVHLCNSSFSRFFVLNSGVFWISHSYNSTTCTDGDLIFNNSIVLHSENFSILKWFDIMTGLTKPHCLICNSCIRVLISLSITKFSITLVIVPTVYHQSLNQYHQHTILWDLET